MESGDYEDDVEDLSSVSPRASGRSVHVKIQNELNGVAMERLLKQYYAKSLRAPHCHFDLSTTVWIGVLELSILTTWILELRSDGRCQVECTLPEAAPTADFLIAFKFESTLRFHGVKTRASTHSDQTPLFLTLQSRPYLPLTFFDRELFDAKVNQLRRDKSLEEYLSDARRSALVSSGVIREIVVVELGDNLFVHGAGKFAHMVMVKQRAPRAPAFAWKDATVSPASIEREFLQKIADQEYLALVIADRGPGIPATLSEAYARDRVTPPKPEATEADLLEYAFEYHSTRRTTSERIGELANIFESADRFPPPTGLYRLAETIKEFGGFMLLRSGRTILTFDAVTGFQGFTRAAGLKILTDFSGTQFKLYFPLRITQPSPVTPTVEGSVNPEDLIPKCLYVDLAPYLSSVEEGNSRSEAEVISRALDFVQRERARRDDIATFVLDGTHDCRLSSKAIHYLLLELARRQSRTQINVVVDPSQRVIEAANALTLLAYPDAKPLRFFDRQFELRALTIGKGWSALARPRKTPRASSEQFGHGLPSMSPVHAVLANTLREGLRGQLQRLVLDRTIGIHRPNITVLLRSKMYCRGFFEIYRVLDDETLRLLLTRWLAIHFLEHLPEIIVSLGRVASALCSTALELLGPSGARIRHVQLATVSTQTEIIRAGLAVPTDSRVLVLTDLIGTGAGVSAVLKYLPQRATSEITAIVDARQSDNRLPGVEASPLKVSAVVKEPLTYHTDLPYGTRFSEVYRIDAVTGRLVPPSASEGAPLWNNIDLERGAEHLERAASEWFIDKIIGPASGCEFGHFESRDSHLLYLFDIERLASIHDQEIARVISANVAYARSLIESLPAPKSIVFPAANPGLDKIAAALLSEFPDAKTIPVPSDILRPTFKGILPDIGDSVIVLDDALVSGTTLLRLYELVEAGGAGAVFSYILVKRGQGSLARQVLSIKGLGRAVIQPAFLTALPIPTYKGTSNCPACVALHDLEECRKKVEGNSIMSGIVDDLSTDLKCTPIGERQAGPSASSGHGLDICSLLRVRWLLECAAAGEVWAQDGLSLLIRDDTRLTANQDLPALLKIIWQERHVFVFDGNRVKLLFDEVSRAHLGVIAARCVEDSDKASDADIFQGSLLILAAFDPVRLSGVLPTLLLRFRNEHRHFGLICVTLLLIQPALASLESLLAALRRSRIPMSWEQDHDAVVVLERVADVWTAKQRDAIATAFDRVSTYRTLAGRAFHECGHYLANIEGALRGKAVDVRAASVNWTFLSKAIRSAYRLWQTNRTLQSETVIRAEERYVALDNLRAEYDQMFLEIENLTGVLNDPKRGSRHVGILAQKIEALKSNLTSAIDTIKWFQVDIKATLNNTLRIHPTLSARGVHYSRGLTEEDAVVYGEEAQIAVAFQNLIDNLIDAGARHFHVEVGLVGTGDMVVLSFFDKGRGLPGDFQYGFGLQNVDSIARDYGGSFAIESVPPDSPKGEEQYQTVAHLRFARIRPSGGVFYAGTSGLV